MATYGSLDLLGQKKIGHRTQQMMSIMQTNSVQSSQVFVEHKAMYKLLLHLEKPTVKTFDELVKLVKDHHQPTPSKSVQ